MSGNRDPNGKNALSSKQFKFSREASRNEDWRIQTSKLVMPKLNKDEQALLKTESLIT